MLNGRIAAVIRSLCISDEYRQNRHELISLCHQRIKPIGLDLSGDVKKPQPIVSLTRLLQRDAAFVNEVGFTLRARSLLEVGSYRGPGIK
jgi:hypothetical protein